MNRFSSLALCILFVASFTVSSPHPAKFSKNIRRNWSRQRSENASLDDSEPTTTLTENLQPSNVVADDPPTTKRRKSGRSSRLASGIVWGSQSVLPYTDASNSVNPVVDTSAIRFSDGGVRWHSQSIEPQWTLKGQRQQRGPRKDFDFYLHPIIPKDRKGKRKIEEEEEHIEEEEEHIEEEEEFDTEDSPTTSIPSDQSFQPSHSDGSEGEKINNNSLASTSTHISRMTDSQGKKRYLIDELSLYQSKKVRKERFWKAWNKAKLNFQMDPLTLAEKVRTLRVPDVHKISVGSLVSVYAKKARGQAYVDAYADARRKLAANARYDRKKNKGVVHRPSLASLAKKKSPKSIYEERELDQRMKIIVKALEREGVDFKAPVEAIEATTRSKSVGAFSAAACTKSILRYITKKRGEKSAVRFRRKREHFYHFRSRVAQKGID